MVGLPTRLYANHSATQACPGRVRQFFFSGPGASVMYRLAGNLEGSLAAADMIGCRQTQAGQRDVNMRFDNPSHPQAGTIGESLPLYALPPDVECQRKEAPRHVGSQAETGPSGSVSYLSTETGVD